MLFSEYRIASLADLEAAIAEGTLLGVPRLGSKTIENWKRGILAYRGRQRRTPLPQALAIANVAVAYLRKGRRRTPLLCGKPAPLRGVVGDIDIVCTSHHAGEVVAHFARWSRAEAVLAEGPTKASIWLSGGLQSICASCPTTFTEISCSISPARASTHQTARICGPQEPAGQRVLHLKSRDRRRNGLRRRAVRLCGVGHAVRSARAAQRTRRDRPRARQRDSGAGRWQRSARRLSHAHDIQ